MVDWIKGVLHYLWKNKAKLGPFSPPNLIILALIGLISWSIAGTLTEKSIKELKEQLETKDATIQRKDADITSLERRISELQSSVSDLKSEIETKHEDSSAPRNINEELARQGVLPQALGIANNVQLEVGKFDAEGCMDGLKAGENSKVKLKVYTAKLDCKNVPKP